MAKYFLDCVGEKCPKPLARVKKLIRIADPGDIIEVLGDDERSKGEVVLAIDGYGYEILDIEEEEGKWRIKFVKGRTK